MHCQWSGLDSHTRNINRYLRTWFAPDIVSSLPKDFWDLLLGRGGQMVKLIRLIRLLKLFRLLKLTRLSIPEFIQDLDIR